MTIPEFAQRYHVRVNDIRLCRKLNLSWSEPVIPGHFGEIADFNDFGETDFRLRLLAVPRHKHMTKALLRRRELAISGGLRLKWKADAESIFYFDPTNEAESKLALSLVKPWTKKTLNLSEEARAKLSRMAHEANAARWGKP